MKLALAIFLSLVGLMLIGIAALLLPPKFAQKDPEVVDILVQPEIAPSATLLYMVGFSYDLVDPAKNGALMAAGLRDGSISDTDSYGTHILFKPLPTDCKPAKSCAQTLLDRKDEIARLRTENALPMANFEKLLAMPPATDGTISVMLRNAPQLVEAQLLHLSSAVVAASSGEEEAAAKMFQEEFDFFYKTLPGVSQAGARTLVLECLQRLLNYFTQASINNPKLAKEPGLSLESRVEELRKLTLDWKRTNEFDLASTNLYIAHDKRPRAWWVQLLFSNGRLLNDRLELLKLNRPLATADNLNFGKTYKQVLDQQAAFCASKRTSSLPELDESRLIACINISDIPKAHFAFRETRALATLALGALEWAKTGGPLTKFPKIMREHDLLNPFNGSDAEVVSAERVIRFQPPVEISDAHAIEMNL